MTESPSLISTLDTAQDGDVPMPGTVYVEVPRMVKQQVNSGVCIIECRANEVHVFTNRNAGAGA
jgi:hypothetical protein